MYMLVGNSDKCERGSSLHTAGRGTVVSGDSVFCIVTLAALDLDTCLDECSSELSDNPSIDKLRGKTQTMLN